MLLLKPLQEQRLHHDEAKIESLHYKAQLMAGYLLQDPQGVIDPSAGGSPAYCVWKRLTRNYIHPHQAQKRTIYCVAIPGG